MRYGLTIIVLVYSSLFVFGQTAADSITIVKQLEDIEVVQQRSARFVSQHENRLVVDAQQIQYMPKFLGTSDPIRYLQSLAGVQTNNETTTGLHINGCDDYQTLVTINDAPVYYPNHLLGLYSTFIGQHFQSIGLEQSVHNGTMANRIGGWADFSTYTSQPKRFGLEGDIGIVNSDLTLTIPIGKRNALRLSARASYINWLYGRWLKVDGYSIRYGFQDYNLTYVGDLTDRDQLVVTGFYSRDNLGISDATQQVTNVRIPWQNIVGSAYWNRRLDKGNWRTTAYYSSFDNKLDIKADTAQVTTNQLFASAGLKNRLNYKLGDRLSLAASLDYEHYFNQPLYFTMRGIEIFATDSVVPALDHGDELSASVDLRHDVCPWFAYNAGVHASGYIYHSKFNWAIDPRVTLHFKPTEDHAISLHYGIYHQYFHKAALTGGGLPTDFFFLASERFKPEYAHSLALRYTGSLVNKQFSLSAELYFKQIYNIAESFGNVLQVLNKRFSYEDYLITGSGRNYGLNVMFQRNQGVVTGYVSYTLGWARRSLPELEGYTDYRYSASSERRHDLKVVLNSRFAKRWNVSAMFVLATGLPYTEAKEAYFLNGEMVCVYSTYNGAHMPLYHRLDLSCSCDIIKTAEHELGINLSLYNVYAHKNAQFMLYRNDLKPIMGTSLVTIIPSISIYGRF